MKVSINPYLSFPTLLAMMLILSSCGGNNSSSKIEERSNNGESSTGMLTLVANGEDFIREGFTTKDGWRMDFNHVYVTLNNVVAHQTEPPFNSMGDNELVSTTSVILVENPVTIDLAEGDENAPPIVVTEKSTPVGFYNAIALKLVKNPETNASIILEGQGVKDGQTINFVLQFPSELSYVCGEFVGEERKGIVEAGGKAELETTFNFDHIFGDGEAPADDELNLDAIGFQPLAEIANNGELNLDLVTLQQRLSPQDYDKLINNLQSLAHVGEGHCKLLVNN